MNTRDSGRARSRAHGQPVATETNQKPQLVALIERLMEKQGVKYYEKNVQNQLIEFVNYYVSETVQEAKTYRDYAQKAKLDVADMRLAIASKNYATFSRPMPMSTVVEVAAIKNAQPLPEIETLASMADDMGGMARAGKPPQVQSTLPLSAEAVTLVNPNI